MLRQLLVFLSQGQTATKNDNAWIDTDKNFDRLSKR